MISEGGSDSHEHERCFDDQEDGVIDNTGLQERPNGPSPDQAYRAALAVCGRATDAREAAQLLDALGLLDHREALLAKRLAPHAV